MKILKSLSKKFSFLFFVLITNSSNSNEPIDIWDLENIKNEDSIKLESNKNLPYDFTNSNVISNNSNLIYVEQEEKIESNKIELIGLYDPAENDLNLNMWDLSDGEKIIKIIEKIQNIELSNDAQKIYEKIILTNAFPPEKNISIDKFINLKIHWLIKKDNLDLIKEFIMKNDQEKFNSELIKHYLDKNLSFQP